MKKIVVTGIGMINSLGLEKESSFKAIVEGQCGIKSIALFDTEGQSVSIAGEIVDFDPLEVLDKKEVKKADRFIQLGLKAAKDAMLDADVGDCNFERFGVCSASGIGGLPNIEKNAITYSQRGAKKISPFFIPSSLINMLGGMVSIRYGLKGPNLSSVTACTASTHSIGEAYKTMAIGGADKMIVVGAESAICGVGIGGFASMKALSTRNDDPLKASRPFDKYRDGFVMGEGAGALVLEFYDDAIKRGAKIYGEIIGFGESGDAYHITMPTQDGPYRSMKAAYEMANRPNIDYINAHGTSTPVNDKNETAAMKQLFGNSVPLVSSTKGQIGHCLGAAGAIEAVITLMAMRDGIIPPTINQTDSDPDCDLDYVPNKARKKDINIAMSNTFGFGGTNGSVIFRRI